VEGSGGPPDDRLRRLEKRLGEASDAAERLFAEAASHASGETHERASDQAHTDPPPAGWQTPGTREPRSSRSELDLLIQMFQSVRDLIPPELQRRLAEALRELLLALRALIDWYLERTEQRREEASEVQDIPIL
jgi:hypothetical protein